MPFRIGIGSCTCRSGPRVPGDAEACQWIATQLNEWRSRLPGDLDAVPADHELALPTEGCPVTCGVHKHSLASGGTLVVWNAFVHTWSRPTYLSFGAIGRLFAEGLLVTEFGEVKEPPDELMWEFR